MAILYERFTDQLIIVGMWWEHSKYSTEKKKIGRAGEFYFLSKLMTKMACMAWEDKDQPRHEECEDSD